jgi:hypothetical protein
MEIEELMRKTFIWMMSVVFTACGVLEAPVGLSGEATGPATPLQLQRAAVEGGAIDPSPGCNAHTFDFLQEYAEVTLPFPINFFGTTYSHLFVNHYGSVTFEWPSSPVAFEMTAYSWPPIIAPFFGPVGFSSEEWGRVQYSDGAISFGGRPAFCVNWIDVVSPGSADKHNRFQLLLVDRSDVGVGDFDIVMNYDQVQWDSYRFQEGPRVDGEDVWVTEPVSVGFSAGNGQENAFYSFPGSMIPGSFLDTNPVTGLTRTMHNSSIPGRHIFEVRNGAEPGDTTPPTSMAIPSTEPNAEGWFTAPVTIQIVATDEGSGVEAIHYSLDGVETIVPGGQAQVTISSEGETVLTWYARDEAGNEEVPHTLVIRIDMTAPALTCQAALNELWPPNHELVPVQVSVQVSDAQSGADSFVLVAATSSEPDDGLGDGNTEGDIQQWEVGTADTQGLLRAERAGPGTGRVYTLSYEGRDQAGNVAACSVVVSVPHDQGG